MLTWAILFLIIACVAAIFGFTGVASGAANISRVLFFIFLVIFLVSVVLGLARGW